jgi:hypothetical protein
MTPIDQPVRTQSGVMFISWGVQNTGETYTSNGIYQGVTHALRGWPGKDSQGLSDAGTA